MNITNTTGIRIWLITENKYIKFLSEQEESYIETFNKNKSKQYSYSRSSLRQALSLIFKIKPLEIPLYAPPGKPPKLKNGLGYVSISHCKDALLLGWGKSPIGVDIENSNRSIKSNKVFKKILNAEELKEANSLNDKENIKKLLKKWVIKEAIAKKEGEPLIINSKKWEWFLNENIALNKKDKKKVNVFQQNIFGWEVGISCNELVNGLPIICSDIIR